MRFFVGSIPWRSVLTVLLSVFVTTAFLVWLVRQTPTGVITTWRHAWSWAIVAQFAVVSLMATFLRMWRYRLLLKPWRPPVGGLLLVTFVRNFTVDLLPMRLGSLSFPVLVRYRLGVPWTPTWAAFAWSIVWDTVGLVLFLWIGWFRLLSVDVRTAWLAVLPGMLTGGLVVLFVLPERVLRGMLVGLLQRRHRTPFRWMRPWLMRHRAVLRGLLSAVLVGRTGVGALLLLSIGIRVCKYGGLYLLYMGYSLRLAEGPLMDPLVFVWTLTFAEMTAMLPVQGIMNIGPWETAWTLASRWLHAQQQAVAPILSALMHWSSQLWEYAVGALALGIVLMGLRFQRVPQPAPDPNREALP